MEGWGQKNLSSCLPFLSSSNLAGTYNLKLKWKVVFFLNIYHYLGGDGGCFLLLVFFFLSQPGKQASSGIFQGEVVACNVFLHAVQAVKCLQPSTDTTLQCKYCWTGCLIEIPTFLPVMLIAFKHLCQSLLQRNPFHPSFRSWAVIFNRLTCVFFRRTICCCCESTYVFWFNKGEFLKVVPPSVGQTGRKASLCYLINTWGGGVLNTDLQKVCYKKERK